MVEHLAVTLKVVSSNLDKGKSVFTIENKVTERMTMVAPSGEQIKSLKSYIMKISPKNLHFPNCKLPCFISEFFSYL